jgi:hypothetical protein
MTLAIQTFFKNLGESVLAIIKVLLLSKFRTEIKYVRRKKSCLILANGPSLTHLINNYPEFLKDKDLFCVNHFPTSEYYERLRPAYYITSAIDLWRDNIEEKFITQRATLFSEMAAKTDWQIEFIVPFEAKRYQNWKKQLMKNRNIRFYHFNNIGVEGWKWLRHILFRKNLGMPRPHNVVISAIYVAINKGYKNIYIWGAEHTQFKEITVDSNNNALINQKHFYDADNSRAEPLDKEGRGSRRVHEILYKFMVAFRSYYILKDYSIYRGAKIWNATPGSLIDAFDRHEKFLHPKK